MLAEAAAVIKGSSAQGTGTGTAATVHQVEGKKLTVSGFVAGQET